MRITDIKCAVIGDSPVIRIVTDEGIDGWGQIESSKPYARAQLPFYKPLVIGQDPTNVARVMIQIRRFGAFKPWGAMVSAIELALWDIAGKAAGVPVYKLLGGKIRDRVHVYNGGVRFPLEERSPEGHAKAMAKMKAAPEGFRLIKQGLAFHGTEPFDNPDFMYDEGIEGKYYPNHGTLTERTMKYLIECVEAMKDVLGDEIGLALDCGPGWTVPDAIRFARALEPLNIMWLEDLIAGDYTPHTMPDAFREVTRATSTPIHTGEQVYLRQNFRELIEKHAVRIIGPDPLDVGGLAEIKWIAEYADLHGLQIAPHGILDGLIGLAGHVQVAAALPQNFIGFEYPVAKPAWWYDIVDGLPDPIVQNGTIEVWDRPGLGVELNPEKAQPYLLEEDRDFFD